MRRYTILIEKTDDGFCASVPALPGCAAMADTKKELEALIYEAILFHIEGLENDGIPVPIEHETDVEVMVFA